MKKATLIQRCSWCGYGLVRALVRTMAVLSMLLVLAFVFLRLYGVPGPLLREAVRRANAAGIPVDIGSITLTLRGWRADHVSFYSKHPDDLMPILEADSLFFARRESDDVGSKGWTFDVEAVGILVNPSVEWGVRIPDGNASRRVERVRASLGFLPNRIELSNGEISWLGSRIHLDGVILNLDEKPTPEHPTLLPVILTEERFQALENRLKMLSFWDGATVDISFSVDAGDYAASWVDFSARAEAFSFREINFSEVEVSGRYAYPDVLLHRASLSLGHQIALLSGGYNLETKQLQGALKNTIVSPQILLLLPGFVHEALVKAELHFDQLPRLDLEFGPARPKDLMNHVSGSFSIREVGYAKMEVDSLRGDLSRKNRRLELTNLQGALLGQEERAQEVGSAMHGGSASGTVFWDGNTREFGVDVDACLDPNLLVRALSPIRIATNIIQRFSFKDQPPRGHVSVGADLDDSDTFYINIQAMGNDVRLQGVEFSSVNVTQTYKSGVLTLDPFAGMQGTDFLKGSASVDFRNSIARFDALSSVPPADIEDLVYPEFNLFGNKIRTEGAVQIKAQGSLDWKTMQTTDFTAEVQAKHLELPVARLDDFSAAVSGKGPLLEVKEALFNMYGGAGHGIFHIQLDPQTNAMPYGLDFKMANAEFLDCLQFAGLSSNPDVFGKLSVETALEADMKKNFFKSANGHGTVLVEEGQLTDLPALRGFSRVMRKMMPGFNAFSITRLQCGFEFKDGVIHSDDAYFEGDLMSAKGHGCYCAENGFDAYVQAQVFSENPVSKVIRVITDPFFKLFEIKLEGPLAKPTWRLEKFSAEK